MAISLAPLRYRKVLSKYGGPIGRLVTSPREFWDGSPCHATAAYLRDDLRPAADYGLHLYDDADGGGMHRSKAVSTYIAISEAIERWAFYATINGSDSARYGFEVDPTTTGMAAFPGITKGAARRIASLEAAERWALLEWWRGNLSIELRGPSGGNAGRAEIITPFQNASVALVWTHSKDKSYITYGFSAGPDFNQACRKAGVELTRNLSVLKTYFESTLSDGDLEMLERRLVYFAKSQGAEEFQKRLRASSSHPTPALPKIIVDEEINGPWSAYTTVWRVLYEHDAGPDLDESVDVFSF